MRFAALMHGAYPDALFLHFFAHSFLIWLVRFFIHKLKMQFAVRNFPPLALGFSELVLFACISRVCFALKHS